MEEAEALCDRIGIMVNGSLQCIGNSKEVNLVLGCVCVEAQGLMYDVYICVLPKQEKVVPDISPIPWFQHGVRAGDGGRDDLVSLVRLTAHRAREKAAASRRREASEAQQQEAAAARGGSGGGGRAQS